MLDVETLGAALKLVKEGGGGGGEGGAVIDDSKISPSTTWSSQKIVDTLCPPFTADGNPVTCTPVANYPLGVKVAWEPRQEGEGNPSPENVRPIVGLDSVQVTRCGKNFMPYSKPSPSTYTENGITFTWNDDGSIHVSGTAVGRVDSNVMYFEDFHLPPGEYRMISSIQPGVVLQFVVKKGNTGTNLWYSMNISIENGDVPQYFYAIVNDGATVDTTIYAFLSYGIENPTDDDYAPYTGTTATLTLPETIYGGTLDVGTGTLTVSQAEIESYNGENLPGQWISDRDIYTPGTQPSIGAQVVYDLAESQTIQLAPQQIIALSGTNTLFADAGNITVTGASDPIATITALQNRVSALESAALN